MMQKNKGHVNTYLALVVALAALFMSFVLFSHNRPKLLIVALCGTVFYAAWGIIHHLIEDRLTFKIVLEYILFGTLSFLLFYITICI